MATISINVGDAAEYNLPLGRQMENEVNQVLFNYSDWASTYGVGTISLSVQRKGDAFPYPVTVSTYNNVATWEISDTDTAHKGTGKAQLTYTVGDQVKKSVIYKFTVYESLGADGDVPSPDHPWFVLIEQEISDINGEIGDLNDLETTAKNNLVAAINEAAQSGGGGGADPYTNNPAALGTASPGSSANYSRGDHVHPMPSASDVGAIATPSTSPTTGQYLKWSGTTWVASDLPVYSGGVS